MGVYTTEVAFLVGVGVVPLEETTMIPPGPCLGRVGPGPTATWVVRT